MLSGRIWRPKYATMAVLIISHARYGHHLPPIEEISGVLCSVRSHGVTERPIEALRGLKTSQDPIGPRWKLLELITMITRVTAVKKSVVESIAPSR